MKKVLLIYWPEKGNVETVCDKIITLFTDAKIKKVSVSQLQKSDLEEYDNWIIGNSTAGAHVWKDADDSNRWFEFFDLLGKIELSSKIVAFYGLGDQVLYPQHFADSLGTLQDEFEKRNIRTVGRWPVTGYTFDESNGVRDGYFYGLALDEDNQEELTEERITGWIQLIGKEFR